MPVVGTKITAPVRFVGHERVGFSGYFSGGVTPVVDDVKSGVTVARTGTGDYTITLPGRGAVVWSSLLFTAEDLAEANVTVVGTDASARTIDILVSNSGGTAADPAAVNFLIFVKESSY